MDSRDSLDGGKDAALIVAIDDYVFASDVPGAVANGNNWYTFLTRSRKVPVGNIRLLRNSEASLEKMRKGAARVGGRMMVWDWFVGARMMVCAKSVGARDLLGLGRVRIFSEERSSAPFNQR